MDLADLIYQFFDILPSQIYVLTRRPVREGKHVATSCLAVAQYRRLTAAGELQARL